MHRTHKLGSVSVAAATEQRTYNHSRQAHHSHYGHHSRASIYHHYRNKLSPPKPSKTFIFVTSLILGLAVLFGAVHQNAQNSLKHAPTQSPVTNTLNASVSPATPTKVANKLTPSKTTKKPVVSQAIQKPPQLPVNNGTQPYVGSLPDNIPVFSSDNFKFYYAGGRQFANATGALVTLPQYLPNTPSNVYAENHSLIELAVMSSDGKQVVEVGWVVDKVMNGDDQPHIFVYHWVNGQTTCYNACGFVQTSSGTFPGQSVATYTDGTYGIQFAKNNWTISYNGNDIGYFPGTLWGNTFTSFGFVEAFGEVALSNNTNTACVQMGNGLAGSDPASAKISNFKLIGSSVPEALSPYATAPSTYTYGMPSVTGLSLGGPGAC